MLTHPHADGGWLRARSQALSDVAQFVGWAVRRVLSPRRIVSTALLVGALIASPWLIRAAPEWGWLWLAVVVAFGAVYSALLLLSYLRLRSAQSAEKMAVTVSALTETQTLREGRLRDNLSNQIGDLEARITHLIDARLDDVRQQSASQLHGVTALSADRLDVLRDNLERRVESLSRTTGQIGAAVRDLAVQSDQALERLARSDQTVSAGLSDLQGGLAQVEESVARRELEARAFAADVETILEARIGSLQVRQDEARNNLERLVASRFDALDAQPAQIVDLFETRMAAERAAVQEAFFALRADVERMLDERGQRAGEGFAYLRALLDRRIQAGTSVLQERMDAFRGELHDRVVAMEDARRAEPVEDFAGDIAVLRAGLQEIGDLRQAVSEALEREVSERSSAISAVVTAVAERQSELEAELRASPPHFEARLGELRSLMDARMGPEFEARLEAWRSRLDNEIGDALQKGRTENEVADQERESRLRGELQSLHDALLRDRESAAGHHSAVVASISSIRADIESQAQVDADRVAIEVVEGAVDALRVETAKRLDGQDEKHGDAVRQLVQAIGETRSDTQALTESLERKISQRLAKVASEAVEALRQETAQRLDAQGQKYGQDVSLIVKAVEETRNAASERAELLEQRVAQRLETIEAEREAAAGRAALDAKAIEERVTGRLAEGVLTRVDGLKAEAHADRAAILAQADQVARERAFEAIAAARDDLASKADVAAAVEAVRDAAGDVASRSDLDAVRLAAEEALRVAGEAALQAAKQREDGRSASTEQMALLEQGIKKVEARANANANAMRRLSDSNAVAARPFERLLSDDKAQRIKQHWLKAFGINMSGTALAYLAHKICLLEDRGHGRIAAPIETIVMRQLALRSLPNRGRLEVLEIGSLFGLSAAVLHNFQGARSSGMFLTLLDPLEGYYEAGGADPVTGIEVNEAILRKNLAELDVPKSDYRLIKELSADAAAIKAASDRLYDFVLVDGDHSTAGVAADFENYGPLVKPGGLIVFDDYGSEHWPGIQPYVDEVVRTDPNWIWIGADYRTAVLAKKADGATARITSPRPTRAPKPATSRSASAPRRKKS